MQIGRYRTEILGLLNDYGTVPVEFNVFRKLKIDGKIQKFPKKENSEFKIITKTTNLI